MGFILKGPTEGGGRSVRYTSTRLYHEDSVKLGELAALRGESSAAETFHKLFGLLLDEAIIEAAERRVAELRGRAHER